MSNRVDPASYAGRIFDGNKIADLTNDFGLDSLKPFSIFIIPKAVINGTVIESATDTGLLVDCKLAFSSSNHLFPCFFNDWSPGFIQTIKAGAIDLTTYDVYWGCGDSGEVA